jgi:hypothetical protein
LAAGVGGEAGAIEREVTRRLAPAILRELIRLTVKDMMGQRKTRR